MFRKTITLDSDPQAARIHITAALKYQLWANGSYVGSGPARSSPEWKSYDTYDLSDSLANGENVIAVLCWFTGTPNNYSCDERAGFWAQLEHIDVAGHTHATGTDESWRVREARGFHREVAAYRGIAPEIYDARLDPQNWASTDFDDASWENAACLTSGEYRGDPQLTASWTYLEPRQTPPMREREIKAEKLVAVGEADADFYPDITDIVERMSGQDLFSLEHARVENADSLVGPGEGAAVFQNNGSSSPQTSLKNLLANRRCYVFVPAENDAPAPAEAFAHLPDQLVLGTCVCERQEGVCDPSGQVDLAPFIGGAEEGRTAYVYIPFTTEDDGLWTIGAGADWWMECYLDGEKIFDTTSHGNGFHPPRFNNFRRKLRLAKGTHLLATRVTSGALGCVLAGGVVSSGQFGRAARDPFVTLDFGRTYNALACIEFDAPAGATIEITTGGELSADGRVSWGSDPNWSRPAAFIAEGGRQRWRLFEPRPVRFLQVVFRNVAQPVTVFDVKLISWEYPAERRGSFACSDDVLTRLWQAGVDTAYLHMDDSLIFDVVRERANWTSTGEVEQGHLAIAAGYGDLPFSRWHLKQTLRSQLSNGLFQIVLGSHGTMNAGFPKPTIPTKACNCLYVLNHMPFVVHNIRNRYRHFGDSGMLKEWYPALMRLADWFVRSSDEQGLLYNLPGQVWFDWVSDQQLRGAHFESNAVYCAMLNHLGEIAAWLNLPEEAEQWKRRATHVRDVLRKMHWNEHRGLFCDSVVDGAQSTYFTELANGMALLYGIADDNQKRRIVNALTPKQNGCTPVTILYFYYLIEGLIKAGAVDDALQQLSDRNRQMMAVSDPPTFWEEWPGTHTTHLAGNSPLHFGGAGVVWTLSSQVLGVQPDAPGFRSCRIYPKCGRLNWARGVVPTVRGDIHVEWRRSADGFALSAVLPDAMPADIFLPFDVSETSILNHNGTCHARQASKGPNWASDGVTVSVTGGSHTLEISS